MPSITDSVNSLLGRGGNFEKLGKAVGIDKDKAELAVNAAAPEIVGGMANKARDRGGVKAVNAVVDGNDGSILDDLGGFFANKKSEEGAVMLDQIFGSDRSNLLESLVSKTGLSEGMVSKVLPLLAPIVSSVIGQKKADEDLDDEGVVTLLSNETADLEKGGFLSGSTAAKGAAVTGAAAAVAGAASKSTKKVSTQSSQPLKGKTESMSDKAKDEASSMKDKASAAKKKAGDVKGQVEGKAAKVKGEAGKAKGKATDAVKGQAAAAKDQAASAKGKAGSVKGQAASAKGRAKAVSGKATTAAGKKAAATTAAADRVGATSKSTKVPTASANNGGMAWLGYAIGLLALVGVLALLATQCSSDDEVAGDGTAASVDAGASDLQALVDAELPDGVSASIDGDVVTLTGEVASDADAAAAVAAADAVEGVASVENKLTVADAPDATEPDAGASDLQALVDAELPDGVSASIDGDVVTLTGEVASGADAAAAVAAADAVEGVASVESELTVADAADTDDADAETPLDDLGNIVFDYAQATITPDGETVVGEWATFLEENPDVNVLIVGHTDNTGPEPGNVTLSQRRADAVKASLEAKGIDAERLTTEGRGSAEPKVENDTEANRETNRRIEFIEQ